MSTNHFDPTDPPGQSRDPAQPGRPVLPQSPPVPDDRVHGDDLVGNEPYGDSWLRPTLTTTAEPASSPATQPRPPRTAAPSPKKSWLIAGLGGTLLLAGVAGMASWDLVTGGLWRSVEESERYTQDIRTIDVHGGSGDVDIRADAQPGTVEVTRRLNWGPGSSRPTPNESVSGTTLQIASDCSGFLSWCSIDYVVHVPTGTAVNLDNGSGDVALSGALGDTVAETGSGDLAVTGSGGTLRFRTGSGDIEAGGLTAKQVNGNSGSGSIELDFVDAPTTVVLEAGSGDVAVRLPQGGYAVDVETGSGNSDVRVTDDPADPDRIQVKTGSGDVEVAYR